MDQSTPVFPCPLCDKVYHNQHSLTRHSHNHEKTSIHTCPTCGVVFSRKDLLARHLKMVHDPLRAGNRPGRRLRCHTACINCRDSRIKCDSNKPCAACSTSGKACVYSDKTARISRKSHLNTNEKSPEESVNISENTPDSFGEEEEDHAFQPGFQDSNMTDLSGENPDDFQSYLPQSSILDGVQFHLNSPSQMIAWPWLHEDLFLQNWDGITGYDPSAMGLHSVPQIDPMQHVLGVEQAENGSLGLQYSHINSQITSLVGGVNNGRPQWNSTTGNEYSLFEVSQPLQPRKIDGMPVLSQFEPTNNFHRRTGDGRPTRDQKDVVSELVDYVRQAKRENLTNDAHATYWYSISMRVREVFNLFSGESPNTSAVHCLDHMVSLFRDNFWTLWPMIPAYTFDGKNINPVLYLAISSIGAMYGGSKASKFGVQLHEALRELLCEPMIESDEIEANSLSLAQSRLLTQVAALYFGQKRAFTYAQHLGSVLIAQARRMELFTAIRNHRDLRRIPTSTLESPETSRWLGRWLLAESRKRLAFGILRAEVYTSVLLNARPLLCADELALELPCSNYLWLTKFTSDSQYVAAIRQDTMSNDYEKMQFGDIVNITMEPNEPMPPLNILSRELLIFGLQEHVWRICHDSDMLARLTGSLRDEEGMYNGLDGPSPVQENSHLWQRGGIHRNRNLSSSQTLLSLESQVRGQTRQMVNLRSQRKRTANALRAWRQKLNQHNSGFSRSDRTSLMSGLLLFHISFLRLYAPIEKLHHISYRVGRAESRQSPDVDIIRAVWEWSTSDQANIAVQHACIVWSLLSEECNRDERQQHRAWFNFLALLGLHHAAVVVWAYAGTHNHSRDDNNDDEEEEIGNGSGGTATTVETDRAKTTRIEFGSASSSFSSAESPRTIPITSATSTELMTRFVHLYGRISPAWSVCGSFLAAAVRLAKNAFPSRPG